MGEKDGWMPSASSAGTPLLGLPRCMQIGWFTPSSTNTLFRISNICRAVLWKSPLGLYSTEIQRGWMGRLKRRIESITASSRTYPSTNVSVTIRRNDRDGSSTCQIYPTRVAVRAAMFECVCVCVAGAWGYIVSEHETANGTVIFVITLYIGVHWRCPMNSGAVIVTLARHISIIMVACLTSDVRSSM